MTVWIKMPRLPLPLHRPVLQGWALAGSWASLLLFSSAPWHQCSSVLVARCPRNPPLHYQQSPLLLPHHPLHPYTNEITPLITASYLMMSSSLPSSSPSPSTSSSSSCTLLLGLELHLTTSTFKHLLSVSLALKHLYTNTKIAQKQLHSQVIPAQDCTPLRIMGLCWEGYLMPEGWEVIQSIIHSAKFEGESLNFGWESPDTTIYMKHCHSYTL